MILIWIFFQKYYNTSEKTVGAQNWIKKDEKIGLGQQTRKNMTGKKTNYTERSTIKNGN